MHAVSQPPTDAGPDSWKGPDQIGANQINRSQINPSQHEDARTQQNSGNRNAHSWDADTHSIPPDAERVFVAARTLGNWVNLSTPIGLAIAAIGGARISRGPRGLWLAEGYRHRFPVGGAFTIGSVVTTSRASFDDLVDRFPRVMQHEEAHTWQYTWALGPLYWPPYCLMLAWSWWRTGDQASRNFFERQAGLADGGYREAPIRSNAEAMAELRRVVTSLRGSATDAGQRVRRWALRER